MSRPLRDPDYMAGGWLRAWGWITTLLFWPVGIVLAIVLLTRGDRKHGGWMLGVCLTWAVVTALVFLPDASEAIANRTSEPARQCRPILQGTQLGIIRIRAKRVDCGTARYVARDWTDLWAIDGRNPRFVVDELDREWRCRIIREATGTDAGYYPYTDVRCRHRVRRVRKIIRFSLAS